MCLQVWARAQRLDQEPDSVNGFLLSMLAAHLTRTGALVSSSYPSPDIMDHRLVTHHSACFCPVLVCVSIAIHQAMLPDGLLILRIRVESIDIMSGCGTQMSFDCRRLRWTHCSWLVQCCMRCHSQTPSPSAACPCTAPLKTARAAISSNSPPWPPSNSTTNALLWTHLVTSIWQPMCTRAQQHRLLTLLQGYCGSACTMKLSLRCLD